MRDLPSIRYLEECFECNPDSGVLTWKRRPAHHFSSARGMKIHHAVCSGKEAGSLNKGDGYIQVGFSRKLWYVHRIIWSMMNGGLSSETQIDHTNGIRHDNRLCNLRIVTNQENGMNRRLSRNSSSGVSGVSWSKSNRKWKSYIKVHGKVIHIGYFDNFESAVQARRMAEAKYGFHENNGSKPAFEYAN